MPMCRKCGQDHFNFKACPPKQPPVPNRMGWGQPFGNARKVETSYLLPMRLRTGSLTEPPEAA